MNTNAKDALKAYREKLRNGEIEKPVRKNPVQKAQENPQSKALAIAGKCYDCTFDSEAEGTWKAQVRDCTCTDCPLWNVRPK
jgi:hypothetical protein|tara:strand:+ start:396 stop:641 length:246 start_codon:yes stop_codon:yes gene_type:complete